MRQSKVSAKRPLVVGGIDPDTKGAICVWDPASHKIEYFNFPGVEEKKLLSEMMRDLTSRYDIRYVGVEKQGLRPTDGPKGYGTLMVAYHMWQMILFLLNIPHELIPPSVWQNKMLLKSDGKDSKTRIFNVARRMFPEESFMNKHKTSGNLLKTRNQGAADATLIAVYVKRHLL